MVKIIFGDGYEVEAEGLNGTCYFSHKPFDTDEMGKHDMTIVRVDGEEMPESVMGMHVQNEFHNAYLALKNQKHPDGTWLIAFAERTPMELLKMDMEAKEQEDKDRIGDVENAVVELAEMSANNEVNIEDLTAAIFELAEMIGG